jgi:glucose/arabinose dehydrogenase
MMTFLQIRCLTMAISLGGYVVLAVRLACAQTNAPVPPEGDLSTPYQVEIVASRLQAPWSVVFAPDKRIFFSERPGWIQVIERGLVLSEPALVLKDVVPSVKMGLLGLALDPEFYANHFLYLGYDAGKEDYRLKVVRYRDTQNRLVEPYTLIDGIPAYRNHTGCRLRFGPERLPLHHYR